MSIGIRSANKKSNEYADTMPDLPKAVIMAIACSAYANCAFAFQPWDNGEPAEVGSPRMLGRIAHEWQILHQQGIVPQPVSKEWQQYL